MKIQSIAANAVERDQHDVGLLALGCSARGERDARGGKQDAGASGAVASKTEFGRHRVYGTTRRGFELKGGLETLGHGGAFSSATQMAMRRTGALHTLLPQWSIAVAKDAAPPFG